MMYFALIGRFPIRGYIDKSLYVFLKMYKSLKLYRKNIYIFFFNVNGFHMKLIFDKSMALGLLPVTNHPIMTVFTLILTDENIIIS